MLPIIFRKQPACKLPKLTGTANLSFLNKTALAHSKSTEDVSLCAGGVRENHIPWQGGTAPALTLEAPVANTAAWLCKLTAGHQRAEGKLYHPASLSLSIPLHFFVLKSWNTANTKPPHICLCRKETGNSYSPAQLQLAWAVGY